MRVMEGRPWLFDNHLFILQLFDAFTKPSKLNFDRKVFWVQIYNLPLGCMNEEYGIQVDGLVGRVMEVDVLEDGIGWGRFLRVKVEIPI